MARFELGTPMLQSNIEDFKKVIFTVSELINEGNAKILFGLGTDTRLEVDDSALNKYEIDKDGFNAIVNFEFIPLLETVLNDSEREFLKLQLRQALSDNSNGNKKGKNNKSQSEKDIKEKINYIKEIIVDEKTRNRYYIKATTKHPKIKDIRWEVNKKLYDSSKNETNFSYATVNIRVSKEFDDENSILKLLPFVKADSKTEELIFDCDEHDIDYIVNILNGIKSNLAKRD